MSKIFILLNYTLKKYEINDNKVVGDDKSKVDEIIKNLFKSKKLKNIKSKV